MKIIRTIAVIGILSIFFLDTYAFPLRKLERQKNRTNHAWRQGPVVHAPLGGAILILLGSAGVAYYLIRQRQKKKQNG